MNTIVSGFIDLQSQNKNRDIQKYLEFGTKLLSINKPKIIFIEPSSYEYLKDKSFPQTHFILIEKNSLFMWDIKDSFKKDELNANPKKDTSEYLTVIANKTEWMSVALELNPFKTDNFIWIDFGIYHVINDIILFERSVEELCKKQYRTVRMASIWDLTKNYNIDWKKNILWYFAGGVFGGSSSYLKKFAEKTKQLYLDTIKDIGYIPWEVNIWYQIYKQNQELFDPYTSDHNPSILQNY